MLLQFVRGRIPLWFLFAGIAAVAAALGLGRWWWLNVEAQREAVRLLRKKGWEVTYRYVKDARSSPFVPQPYGPPFLVKWLGVDAFNDVVSVERDIEVVRLFDASIGPSDLEDAEIESINQLSRLEDLGFKNCRLSVEAATELRLNELKQLTVSQCDTVDEALATFRRCLQLQTVAVRDSPVQGSFLIPLCESCDLQEVTLEVSQCDATVIDALGRESTLRELWLWSPVGDAEVKILTQHGALEALGISGPGVTDLSCPHIARCSAVTNLSLIQTSVSPQGLASLQGLKHLRRFFITEIDDSWLPALEGLAPSVTNLWVFGLSDPALARLRAKGISVNGERS